MTDLSTIEHDPPPTPREKEHAIWLGLAIAGPPALWTLQILLVGPFAMYACFPGDVPLGSVPDNMRWVSGFEIAFNVAAIVLALACGWVSVRYYRVAQERIAGNRGALSLWHLDRLCFMAMGGMLSAGGFLTAIVFETIASLMVLPCSG